MSGRIPVIAIDGPGASGKGAVSHHLAGRYGFHLLDSGALYRLVGLRARQAGILLEEPPLDAVRLAELASGMAVTFTPTGNPEGPLIITLDGVGVTRQLRTDEAGTDASAVAALPEVRRALYRLQQSLRRPPGLVADGRDMGTVVFPDAAAKLFLTASAEARAERRLKQLAAARPKAFGLRRHLRRRRRLQDPAQDANLGGLLESIKARDQRDRTREASPLRPADDALVIDSTHLGMAEVLEQVDAYVAEKLGSPAAIGQRPPAQP